MKDVILQKLAQIEQENSVRILLAVESGSRAWGYDSPDSDYDVRFIYVHPLDWYLRVLPQPDVIQYMSDDHQLDFSGWELRKTLQLLRKTNPNLSDWLMTDVIYMADPQFLQEIRVAQAENYNPIHAIYHFFNIAKKHDEAYLSRNGYTLKRFLYFLRGLLACEYIERHKCHPPVRFEKLVEATIEDSEIKTQIDEMIRLKRISKESYGNPVAPELVEYAYKIYHRLQPDIDKFRPDTSLPLPTHLDQILQHYIKEY